MRSDSKITAIYSQLISEINQTKNLIRTAKREEDTEKVEHLTRVLKEAQYRIEQLNLLTLPKEEIDQKKLVISVMDEAVTSTLLSIIINKMEESIEKIQGHGVGHDSIDVLPKTTYQSLLQHYLAETNEEKESFLKTLIGFVKIGLNPVLTKEIDLDYEWIMNPKYKSNFSFAFCCDVCDIEAEYLRGLFYKIENSSIYDCITYYKRFVTFTAFLSSLKNQEREDEDEGESYYGTETSVVNGERFPFS